MRFVQVTDTHIVPRGRSLHRLNPVHRLELCVADVNRHHDELSFCVITGDLTHRGDLESYGVLREIVQELKLPYHLILGNHDRREPFLEAFPDTPRDENGFVQYQTDSPEGVFLFLDTLDEGNNSGIYCELRRGWLEQRLREAGDRPVYLFMHHPPFDIGLPALDCMKLEDAESFAKVLEGTNVEHLFFGHVHRAVSGRWRKIPFSALPGTNHQVATDFKTVSPIPLSHGPPAYAFVHLDGACQLVHLHYYIDDYPRRLPDRSWPDALSSR